MKYYDFDGMFDEKLSEYIRKNSAKYKEEQWQDIIPTLYKKFGDTKIKSINMTPNEYYNRMSDEDLVKSLSGHLRQQIPVSEFLCNAIESRDLVKLLLPLLDGSEDERSYAINLIGATEEAFPKYMQMIETSQDIDIVNTCVDYVKEQADLVLTDAKALYHKGVQQEYMLEILSRCQTRDEEIYQLLLTAFRTDIDNIPMHASYLAAYGDERALPYLLDKIDEEGISFIEYQELKYAIEALGGEYNKEKNFDGDPYYDLIKSSGANAADLFSTIEEK